MTNPKIMRIKFSIITTAVFFATALGTQGQDGSTLLDIFERPPDAARSSAFWGWIDGNVTPEGITADLESMREVGMSGAIQFTLGMDIAPGPVECASDEYFELVGHTLREAARLDMEMGFHNGPGFSSSGGPWVEPEDAMKILVWTEARADGGGPVNISLPQPAPDRRLYRDIAVLAVPESAAESDLLLSRTFKMSSGGEPLDAKPLFNGDWRQGVLWKDGTAVIEFAEPVSATSLGMAIPGPGSRKATLEVSQDGVVFEPVGVLQIDSEFGPQVFSSSGADTFPFATGRFWRIALEPAQNTRVSWLTLRGRPIATDFDVFTAIRGSKTNHFPDLAANELLASGRYPELSEILDVSASMAPDGSLNWDAPAGEWTILRIGYALNERTNRPATPSGLGLEVDKFDPAAVRRYFAAYPAKWADLADQTPGLKPLLMFIDSYEVGSQNWSPVVPEGFRADHDYPITPWLAAFTGRIIGSPSQTENFYWDLRRTFVRLFADNYFGELRRLANGRGMRLAVQSAGGYKGGFSRVENAYAADEFHVEFWTRSGHDQQPSGRGGAHIARTSGRSQVVGAEAFTSEPGDDSWRQHPRSLKKFADLAFAGGVNRMIFHSSAHQPYPGVQMSYGRWGVNFHRHNTWWPLSRPFHDYLSRCAALLQAGTSTAEVLILMDDIEPGTLPIGPVGHLGAYEADQCGPSRLQDARVECGMIVLESGTSYHLMVLGRESNRVSPELAERIADLVEAGAPLLGQPFTGTRGLARQPQADERVRAAAKRIWEAGHPHVHISGTPADILRVMGVSPIFEFAGATPTKVYQISRHLGGESVFFLTNANENPVRFSARFHAPAPTAELWNPITAERRPAKAKKLGDGRAEMEMELAARESVFVVFPRHPTTVGETPPNREYSAAMSIDGPWTLIFPANSGTPGEIELSDLTDLVTHADDGVRFFSGVVTYTTEFEWTGAAADAVLEFDRIELIAEVELNGKKLGGLWYPPYRVACDQALRKGTNRLTVKVANNWVNRMIGDERFPDDAKYEKDRFPRDPGYNLVEWPEWLLRSLPRPTKRVAFPVYKCWKSDDPLQPSGIIGGARLLFREN
jgi:hypothetical protein